MAGMTESKKRDFASQLIVVIEQNATLLSAKGFDPAAKIAELKDQLVIADEAEGRQVEAKAAAKDATAVAQNTLRTVYDNASATVDLISGLLGKNHNLVQEIKKFRKTGRTERRPEAREA